MSPLTTAVAVAGLAVVVSAITAARHGHPGPKRTSLFETEDGDRANPFSTLSEGAESTAQCDDCGSTIEPSSHGFCVTCGSTAPADD